MLRCACYWRDGLGPFERGAMIAPIRTEVTMPTHRSPPSSSCFPMPVARVGTNRAASRPRGRNGKFRDNHRGRGRLSPRRTNLIGTCFAG
jgi:hypothetical protein